jgi:hypothetical protein
MDKAYALRTPIVVCVLEKNIDQFRPKQEDVLGPEYPYLSVIGTLMYLTYIPKWHWCIDVSYK